MNAIARFSTREASRSANISAASGLDQIDDSRGLATCDWNHDGLQDFWISNRTSPRVRLLLNESSPDAAPGFVALRLKGTTCNRDAIGARVELYVNGEQRPRIRSVRAGDGFLSQSSRWLHFGLGDGSIRKVVVRWPGGNAESVTGVTPGAFFQIEQGAGTATTWEPPAATLPNLELTPPDSNGGTRTWIVGRVPMPSATYSDFDEKPKTTRVSKITALNLWSASCQPCLEELKEWTAEAEALRDAGIGVTALCVDHLGEEPAPVDPRDVIRSLGFPFQAGLASRQLVNAMEVVHRAYIPLQKPLPVPTTFLLDSRGRIAAIYKGRVSVSTLIADAARIASPIEEQRETAVPFKGSWAALPFPSAPLRIAATFSSVGSAEAAIQYVEDLLEEPGEKLDDLLDDKSIKQLVGRGHTLLGELHLDNGDPQRAAAAYRPLLKLAPDDHSLHRGIGDSLLTKNLAQLALPHLLLAHRASPDDPSLEFNLGLAEFGAKQYASAISRFRKVISAQPDDLATHYQLANALLATGDALEACEHYEEALRIQPDWPLASHQLAWLRATWPDPRVRDGKRAVELAESVCQRDGSNNPVTLHTLSAALAESGNFTEALRMNGRASEIADSDNRYEKFRATLKEARGKLAAQEPIRTMGKELRH